LAFTVGLQSGCPIGRCGNYTNQPWDTSAFLPNGTLRMDWLNRLNLIIQKADQIGMVVIINFFLSRSRS